MGEKRTPDTITARVVCRQSRIEPLSYVPIGYTRTIACLTSGAISKQEAIMATVEGDANYEFSLLLLRLLKTSFTYYMSRQNLSERLLACKKIL